MNDLSTRLTLDGSNFNQGMDQSTKKVEDFQKKSDKAADSVNKFGDSAKKSTKELLSEMGKISGAERSMTGYQRKLSQIQKDIQDLTVNYRAMNAEMRNGDVGRAALQRIQELTTEAAKYKDAVMDARASVQTLASDTAAWDAMKQGITTVSSALQGVVSAGILGKKSTEDLVAVIAKLKGVEAATNAVIQVGNALQKESALMMGIAKVQSLALTKAKELETAATVKATIAQKALNVVAKANPYVLLASAIIAVGSALLIFSKRAKDANKEIKTAADYQKQFNDKLTDTRGSVVQSIAKFKLLEGQYRALKTEAEKDKWIKENQKKFDELNLSVNNINDADNIFIKQAAKVIEAMKLRAEVAAMMATYEEQYAEAYKESLKAQEERTNAFKPGNTMKKEWKAAGLEVGTDIKQTTTTMQSTAGATNWTMYSLTPEGERKLHEYYKNLGTQVMENFDKGMEPAIQEMNQKMADAIKLENETGAFKTNEPSGGKGGNKEDEDKLKNAQSQLVILQAQKRELEEQRYLYKEGSEAYKDWLKKLNDIENQIKKIKEEEQQYISLLNRPQLPQLEKIDSSKLFKNQTITVNVDPEIKADKMVERFQEAQKRVQQIKDWLDVGAIGKEAAQQMVDEINKELKDHNITAEVKLEVDTESVEEFRSKLRDVVDGMDEIGSVAGGVVGSINSIYEAFNDLDDKLADAENGWESFFAVFSTGIQVFQAATTIIEAIATITELMTKAKQKDTQATNQNTLSTQQNATAAGAAVAPKMEEALTSGVAAATKGGESVASIPYVGAFMAVAMIATIAATILSVIGMLKGFATGGVVGGNSFTGDKILARLNSGELVLNQEQQNTLWNSMNNGDSYNQGKVEFTIKGENLVGVLNNYTRKYNRL